MSKQHPRLPRLLSSVEQKEAYYYITNGTLALYGAHAINHDNSWCSMCVTNTTLYAQLYYYSTILKSFIMRNDQMKEAQYKNSNLDVQLSVPQKLVVWATYFRLGHSPVWVRSGHCGIDICGLTRVTRGRGGVRLKLGIWSSSKCQIQSIIGGGTECWPIMKNTTNMQQQFCSERPLSKCQQQQ